MRRQELTDISDSYAEDAINELVEKGILTGKENNLFDPTGNITRQPPVD
jgi:transcriptional regulator CtsR